MEDDIRVAEILGWKRCGTFEGYPVFLPPHTKNRASACPRFTTDPAADYLVLEWCSNNFRFSRRAQYEIALQKVISGRHEVLDGELIAFRGLMWMYEPGDYSRALLVMKDGGLL